MSIDVQGNGNRIAGANFYEINLSPDSARALAQQLMEAQDVDGSVRLSVSGNGDVSAHNIPFSEYSLDELVAAKLRLSAMRKWALKKQFFNQGNLWIYFILLLLCLFLVLSLSTWHTMLAAWFKFVPIAAAISLLWVFKVFCHQMRAAHDICQETTEALGAVERELAKRHLLAGYS